jgi:hypothetical protein
MSRQKIGEGDSQGEKMGRYRIGGKVKKREDFF